MISLCDPFLFCKPLICFHYYLTIVINPFTTNVAFSQQKSRVRCLVRRGHTAGQFPAKLFYLVGLVLLLSDLSYFKVLERGQRLLWRLEIEGFCEARWLTTTSGM